MVTFQQYVVFQHLSMMLVHLHVCVFVRKDANRLVSSTSRSLWRSGFLRRCFVSFTTCWKTGQDRGDRTVPHGDGWSWYLCFEWWHRSTRTLCITKIDRGRCQCALVFEIPKPLGFVIPGTHGEKVCKHICTIAEKIGWSEPLPTNIAHLPRRFSRWSSIFKYCSYCMLVNQTGGSPENRERLLDRKLVNFGTWRSWSSQLHWMDDSYTLYVNVR